MCVCVCVFLLLFFLSYFDCDSRLSLKIFQSFFLSLRLDGYDATSSPGLSLDLKRLHASSSSSSLSMVIFLTLRLRPYIKKINRKTLYKELGKRGEMKKKKSLFKRK